MISLIAGKRNYVIGVSLVALAIVLFFGNLSFVRGNPGGFDFLAHWQGTRLFITEGIDPYSDSSTSQINALINEQGAADEGDYRFTAPLYSIILYAPLSLIKNYEIARAIWMTFLECLLVLSGILVLNWTRWKISLSVKALLLIILVFSVPSVTSLLTGNPSIVSFVLLAGAITFLLKRQDEAAGLLLAFSLIKPEMVYLIVLILLIWARVRKRTRLVGCFLGTFALMIGFSMLLIPEWPIAFVQGIINYSTGNPIQVAGTAPSAINIRLLIAKNLALIVLLVFEWFAVKIHGSKRLIWNIAVLLVISQWIGNSVNIEHTIFIIPALYVGLAFLMEVWKGKVALVSILLPIALFILTWAFSGVIFPGISAVWSTVILTIMTPSVVLVLLYWTRWWVIRSEKFSVESL
ncbi:MAG: glycosyltransferase family 87 protein [Smithella sp.]